MLDGMSLDPAALLASILISGVGFGLFGYGKKLRRTPHIATGILMMVYPYFISSAGTMFVIGGVLLALLAALVRMGA